MNIKYLKWNLFLLSAFFISVSLSGCSQGGTGFYVDSVKTLKRFKAAEFYGPNKETNCENYRRFVAGICDTKSQKYILCYDFNEEKYNKSRCE